MNPTQLPTTTGIGLGELFTREQLISGTIATLVLFLLVFLLRRFALKWVEKTHWSSEQPRLRWTAQIKIGSFLVVIAGILVVWGSELQALAFSTIAFTVAFVLVAKELIMCILGSIVRMSSEEFKLGDRVSVGTVRGDVVNFGLFTTTLLEIGNGHQRTGRFITVPNSVLLTQTVHNEAYTADFLLQTISLPIARNIGFEKAEGAVKEVAEEACREFILPAQRSLDEHARRIGVLPPTAGPKIRVEVPVRGRLRLTVRYPTPREQSSVIEQKIIRLMLQRHPEILGFSNAPHDH